MKFIHCSGQSIHYKYIKGNGERTFVFANSLGTDFQIWDEVVDHLKDAGSVLCFDKPGHGLSQTAASRGSIAVYLQVLVELLDVLKIERCVFIGLSIGGLMGQLMAVKHPERIERLILSNTAANIGDPDYWNKRIETVKQDGLLPLSDMILDRWMSAHFLEHNKPAAEGLRRMLESCATSGYIQACEVLRDSDFSDTNQDITVPTLCIAGSEDKAVSPGEVQALAAGIPNAAMVVMNGVGHIPGVEAPLQFAQTILDFITEPVSTLNEKKQITGL